MTSGQWVRKKRCCQNISSGSTTFLAEQCWETLQTSFMRASRRLGFRYPMISIYLWKDLKVRRYLLGLWENLGMSLTEWDTMVGCGTFSWKEGPFLRYYGRLRHFQLKRRAFSFDSTGFPLGAGEEWHRLWRYVFPYRRGGSQEDSTYW